MAHAETQETTAEDTGEAQQHPIGIYLWVWGLLFVLSVFSYMVDYLEFEGYLKWLLIVLFMWLKAGLIVAVFMHMVWERPALILAILLPPGAIAVLVALMAIEANYTHILRQLFFLG